MHRRLFEISIYPTIYFVMVVMLFSSAAHGYNEPSHKRHLLESFSVFVPVIPDQAKKPGWFKPKVKPASNKKIKTTSSSKSTSGKRKPIRSTQVNKRRLAVTNNVGTRRGVVNSAERISSKKVGATKKVLSSRALTATSKKSAITKLRTQQFPTNSVKGSKLKRINAAKSTIRGGTPRGYLSRRLEKADRGLKKSSNSDGHRGNGVARLPAKKLEQASQRIVTKGGDKFSRSPKSIQDQATLRAAQAGQGTVIIKKLNDRKFKGMEKMELKLKSANGNVSVVHYVRDPKTGAGMDFKFKKHSTEGIKPWGSDPAVAPGGLK